MKPPERTERDNALAVIWFLRETPWRGIVKFAWGVKRLSQPEFVTRLRRIGVTPKGTKSP